MLFARQEKFFASLETQMDLLTVATGLLLEGAQTNSSGAEIAGRIDRLRRQAGELEAQMVRELSRTLITPIDPEDIVRLSCLMKRLLDSLAGAAALHVYWPCQPAPAELVKQLEIIHQCSLSLRCALGSFRDGALTRHCDEIGQLGAQASRIARQARVKLFDSDLGPIGVIRLRETYDLTEIVLSRYMTLSQTLQRIKLKNG